MKYIVFKHKVLFIPVIIPEHAKHSDINLKDSEVISAGFFFKEKEGRIVTFGASESLKLEPHDRDAELIENTLNNSGMYNFLDL